MKELVLLVGISGSGKSTLALDYIDQDWIEINRDTFRFHLFTNGVGDWSKYKFTKDREKEVTNYCLALWEVAIKSGKSVVVSNTNLKKKDWEYWEAKAIEAGYRFKVRLVPIELEEALKRDAKRGGLSVGREVIFKQWKAWLEITNYKTYTPNENLPKAIWVDIDGTVALNNNRDIHDYSKVLTDTPRLDIISMIDAWAWVDKLEVVFMSGRPESCRKDTIEWLNAYFNNVDYLFMRADGDKRNDRIVKEELFWNHLAPNWNIVASIDDRKRVVRLQHDLRIPNVIDVSQTYEEY